jgi:hypothetical protein
MIAMHQFPQADQQLGMGSFINIIFRVGMAFHVFMLIIYNDLLYSDLSEFRSNEQET